MVPDANQVLVQYLDEHPKVSAEWQANHKFKNDPCVTHVGRFLRHTILDEITQLWNVLRGNESGGTATDSR